MSANVYDLLCQTLEGRLKALEDEREQTSALLVTMRQKANQTPTAPHTDDPTDYRAKRDKPKPRSKRVHWTQRPENAAKVAAMHRKASRTRKAAQ